MIIAPQMARDQRPATFGNAFGGRYGLMIGSIGLAQIVVSQTTAQAHSGALVTLLHSLANTLGYTDLGTGVVPTEALTASALVSLVSVLIGGTLMLICVVLAARFAARESGNAGAGIRGGMLAATYGGLYWLAWSILGSLVTQTDGFVLAADPYAGGVGQILAILGVVFVRGALLWGFSLLAALICASLAAESGAQRAFAPAKRG